MKRLIKTNYLTKRLHGVQKRTEKEAEAESSDERGKMSNIDEWNARRKERGFDENEQVIKRYLGISKEPTTKKRREWQRGTRNYTQNVHTTDCALISIWTWMKEEKNRKYFRLLWHFVKCVHWKWISYTSNWMPQQHMHARIHTGTPKCPSYMTQYDFDFTIQ